MSTGRPLEVQPAGRPDIDVFLENFLAAEPGRSASVVSLAGGAYRFGGAVDVRRPAASVLKLPLVMAVFAAAEAGRIDLSAAVPLQALGETRYPTIMAAFDPKRELTIMELSALSLSASDNLAANYLLHLIGVRNLRNYLNEIGCHATTVDFGFTDSELPLLRHGNWTTAADLTTVLLQLRRSVRLSSVLLPILCNGLLKSRIGLRLPEDLAIANKSGTLNGVSNDAAIIRDEFLEVLVVFLAEGQNDPALTGIEIGDTTFQVWRSLGGRTDAISA